MLIVLNSLSIIVAYSYARGQQLYILSTALILDLMINSIEINLIYWWVIMIMIILVYEEFNNK